MFHWFAASVVSLGLALSAAPSADKPAATDCCQKQLACCAAKRACCEAPAKLGCCAKGLACCAKDMPCCSAPQECCRQGSACCEQAKACCGVKAEKAAAAKGSGTACCCTK